MNIIGCKIGEDGVYQAELSDGRIQCSHDIPSNLQEWIDAGNTPDPYVGPTALENWVEDMARSDAILPRWGEDILDGMANKLSVPQITLDRLQAKKDLRATKP
jgi:hypothetical protein